MNAYVKNLFKMWRPRVIFWDMWMTLGMSHCREPIGLAQRIFRDDLPLGSHGLPEPTDDFLRFCLTNPTPEPRTFLEEAASAFGWQLTGERVDSFVKIARTESNCIALFPDVETTLEFAKQMGFRQGIISNLWPFPAERLFNDTVLGRYFGRDDIICSFSVRHRKPEPEIFEEAVRRFGVNPEDCLMVGDNLSADIEGALRFGMKAALIDRLEKVQPESLIQLSNRLDHETPPVLYLSDLRQLIEYLTLCPTEGEAA